MASYLFHNRNNMYNKNLNVTRVQPGKPGCGNLVFKSGRSQYHRSVFAWLVVELAAGLLTVFRFVALSSLRRPCQESNCPRRYLRLQGSPGGPASRHVTSNQLPTTDFTAVLNRFSSGKRHFKTRAGRDPKF